MTENPPSASASTSNQPDPHNPPRFQSGWIGGLLSVLDRNYEPEIKTALLQACAAFHYRDVQMETITSQYRNNLAGFIQFLAEQWQWQIKYDPTAKTIWADENKNDCVCPLVQESSQIISGTLCHCSEGFAARMFSEVVGTPVTATVIQSILRGDQSCVYWIQL